MSEWKGEHIIQIVCQPIEIKLEQIAPTLLAIQHTVVFSWIKNYLVCQRIYDDGYYNTEKKIAGYLTIIWDIMYIKTEFHKFIVVDGNTGEVKFSDRMDVISDCFYFPISNIEDKVSIAIYRHIREFENAIKRK